MKVRLDVALTERGLCPSREQAKTGVVLSTKARLKSGDKVFVTTDTQLNAHLLKIKKLISLRITAKFMAGKKAEVCINGKLFYSDDT